MMEPKPQDTKKEMVVRDGERSHFGLYMNGKFTNETDREGTASRTKCGQSATRRRGAHSLHVVDGIRVVILHRGSYGLHHKQCLEA